MTAVFFFLFLPPRLFRRSGLQRAAVAVIGQQRWGRNQHVNSKGRDEDDPLRPFFFFLLMIEAASLRRRFCRVQT